MTDKSRQNRFVFLDVMRGIAPVLVIYSHVVALFLVPHKVDTHVVDLLNENFRDPLRLEQQMGHLAVVMFFLVSGFIITQVGTQESHREFLVKRLFRIYPLLIVTVSLTAVLSIWHLQVLRTGQHFWISLQSVLTNFTLSNYFIVPQVILVGVAWTLVIEVIFYAIVLSMLAILRRWAWLAILIEMAMVLAALLLAREFGPSFFLLAVNMSYLPVVLLGQVTWSVWSGRVPLWAGTLLGFGCWTLYVLGDIRNMGRLDDAYSSTAALGFGLFIVLLLAESRLRPMKPISFFADRSYSLYLLHGPIAFPVFESLYGKLPLIVVIILGLALTVGAAELTFRFVEQPGQRIGRKLSKRFRMKKPEPAPPPEDDYEDDYDEDEEYEDAEEYAEPPTRPAASPASLRTPLRPTPRRPAPTRHPIPAELPTLRSDPHPNQPAAPTPAWPTHHPDDKEAPQKSAPRNGTPARQTVDPAPRKENATPPNGDSVRRNGTPAPRKGDSGLPNGARIPRNSDPAWPSGDPAPHHGDPAPSTNRPRSRRDGAALSNGNSPSRNGHAAWPSGDPAPHNGRRNGIRTRNEPAWPDDDPQDAARPRSNGNPRRDDAPVPSSADAAPAWPTGDPAPNGNAHHNGNGRRISAPAPSSGRHRRRED